MATETSRTDRIAASAPATGAADQRRTRVDEADGVASNHARTLASEP